MSKRVLIMFSSKIFVVSGLTFKPLIHLSLFFVYGIRRASLVAQTKESACKARDLDLIPMSGRAPGEGNGNPV